MFGLMFYTIPFARNDSLLAIVIGIGFLVLGIFGIIVLRSEVRSGRLRREEL